MKIFSALTLSVFFTAQALGIDLIYTAAVIDNQYEMRKHEYLYSLEVLKRLGIRPHIVESCKTASFFDELSFPVHYTQTNDPRLSNKGVNEAKSLLAGLNHYRFDKNSILIKLTGRYFFTDDSFLMCIEKHPEIDAFVKQVENSSTFTGCFALRCCYFQQFLKQLNLRKLEREKTSIEDELSRFLDKNPHIKTLKLDSLGITANIFGEGSCQLTYW